MDIKLLGDVSSSDILYKLILLLANRVGSKIDYSKIANLLGINRLKVKEYILLLEYTYLIRTVKPFTKGIDKEITKQSKIFFADSGLLQICGQTSSGAIFENTIVVGAVEEGTNWAGAAYVFEKSNNSLKIVDYGGRAFGEDSKGQEVKFLMSQNAPKTYIDLDYSNSNKTFPIKEVIIGPKNSVLQSAISIYLETLKITNVVVKNSKASYK